MVVVWILNDVCEFLEGEKGVELIASCTYLLRPDRKRETMGGGETLLWPLPESKLTIGRFGYECFLIRNRIDDDAAETFFWRIGV